MRLIFVAPLPGRSGVGDYAADLFPHLANSCEAIEWIDAGSVGPTLRFTSRLVRTLRAAVSKKAEDAPSHLHFEFSGGIVAPFWALLFLGRKRRTKVTISATIHDAPHPVWWPLRFQWAARWNLAGHAVHYPIRALWHHLEARALEGVQLFVLTSDGRKALERGGRSAVLIRHYVPERPLIKEASLRPPAIGLFGQYYGGKGMDSLADLRRAVPEGLEIHVAGRGTEGLTPVQGVTVWGAVDGPREDSFFASVRVLVMPYDDLSRYGTIYSASGVLCRALAYRTPVVVSAVRAFSGESDQQAVRTGSGLPELARLASDLAVRSTELRQAALAIEQMTRSRDPRSVATAMHELMASHGGH